VSRERCRVRNRE